MEKETPPDKFGPSEEGRREKVSRKQYSPIDDALMDWRFDEDLVAFLRELGVANKPSGLPEDTRNLKILELSRTESQALLLGMSRAAAGLWLEKHPDSDVAQVVLHGGFDLLAENLIDLLLDVAPEVSPASDTDIHPSR